MKVCVLDFDVFSTAGGGQTFYRRFIERHPDFEIHYPSRGLDLRAAVRASLPANAHPFGFDQNWPTEELLAFAGELSEYEKESWGRPLARIAVALQGRRFDVVEVPSFFPAGHLVRPLLSALGAQADRISLGLHGWISVGLRNGFSGEVEPKIMAQLEEMERRTTLAADVLYTVSDLHAAENALDRPVQTVDMHDALPDMSPPSPTPPGAGPPDVWFVGRLDRNKGSDLFIELVSRLPRSAYRRCLLCGSDNDWAPAGQRWSDAVMGLAEAKNVEAEYIGPLDSASLAARVYEGRSVVVVPSRSDTFNYVALEALTKGCPILLSDQAGAAGFLLERHPEIAPPIMSPDDLDAAAAELETLVGDYEARSMALRASLGARPWPKPRTSFISPIYSSPPAAGLAAAANGAAPTGPPGRALAHPIAMVWRSGVIASIRPELLIVVVASGRERPDELRTTLASLRCSGGGAPRVSVVLQASDGSRDVEEIVREMTPWAELIPVSDASLMPELKELLAAPVEFVGFAVPGLSFDNDVLVRLAAELRADPGAWVAVAGQVSTDGSGLLHERRAADRYLAEGGRAGGLPFGSPALFRPDAVSIQATTLDDPSAWLVARRASDRRAHAARSAEVGGWRHLFDDGAETRADRSAGRFA